MVCKLSIHVASTQPCRHFAALDFYIQLLQGTQYIAQQRGCHTLMTYCSVPLQCYKQTALEVYPRSYVCTTVYAYEAIALCVAAGSLHTAKALPQAMACGWPLVSLEDSSPCLPLKWCGLSLSSP